MKTNKDSFVSIDFEHLTPNHETACAVGMVKVIRSVIVQEFYSLIKPAPDERTKLNTFVHGITEEMCADAPTFAELLPWMEKFVGNLSLVAHNIGTEKAVLEKSCRFYGLIGSPLCQPEMTDTYRITEKSLPDSCREYGIVLSEHHNALEDARACAELYLKLEGEGMVKAKPEERKPADNHTNEDKELFKPLPDEDVENKNNFFFHKHVLTTGTLKSFGREEIRIKLKSLGAINLKNPTKKTEIVIVGDEPGPSKMEKIKEYPNIIILHEEDLLKILNEL